MYIDGLIGNGFIVKKINGVEVSDDEEIYSLNIPGTFEVEITNFDPTAEYWVLWLIGKSKMGRFDFDVYSMDNRFLFSGLSDISGYYVSVKDIYEETGSLQFKIKIIGDMIGFSSNEILAIKASCVGQIETPVKMLQIIQRANKISYMAGEKFDPKGMVVEGYHYGDYKTILSNNKLNIEDRELTIYDSFVSICYNALEVRHPIVVEGKVIHPTITNYVRRKKIVNWGNWEKLDTEEVKVYRTDDYEIKTVLSFSTNDLNVGFATPLDIKLKLQIATIDKENIFQQFYAGNILYNATNKKEAIVYVGEAINYGQTMEIELTYYNANITFKNIIGVYYREPKNFYSTGEKKLIPLSNRVTAQLDLKEGVSSFVLDDFLAEDTQSFIGISHCYHPSIGDSYYGKNFRLNLEERLEMLNPTSLFPNPIYTNAFGEQEIFSLSVYYYENGSRVYLNKNQQSYLTYDNSNLHYNDHIVYLEYNGSARYFHFTELPAVIQNDKHYIELEEIEPYTERPCYWLCKNGIFKGFNLHGKLMVIMDCFQNYIDISYDDKMRISQVYKNAYGSFNFTYNEDTGLLQSIQTYDRVLIYSYTANKKLTSISSSKSIHNIRIIYEAVNDSSGVDNPINSITDYENKFQFDYEMDLKLNQRLVKIENSIDASFIQIEYNDKVVTFTNQDNNQSIYELDDLGRMIYNYELIQQKVSKALYYVYNAREYDCDNVAQMTAGVDYLNLYSLKDFKNKVNYNEANSQTTTFNQQHLVDTITNYQNTSNGHYFSTQVYTYEEEHNQVKEIYHVIQYFNSSDISFFITAETKLFYLDDGYTLGKKAIYYSEYDAEENKTPLFVEVYDYAYDSNGYLVSTDFYRISGAPSITELQKENADYAYVLNKKEYFASGLVKKEYDVTNNHAVEYTYTQHENTVMKRTYGQQVTNYSYDNLSRLIQINAVDEAGVSNQNQISYQDDLIEQYTSSTNSSIKFDYDIKNRLEFIYIDGQLMKSYSYEENLLDVDNALYDSVKGLDCLDNTTVKKMYKSKDILKLYQNKQLILDYRFDALGRAISIKDKDCNENTSITYHSGGNVKKITKKDENDTLLNEEEYTYDDKDRLIKETSYDRTWEYTYQNKVQDLVTDIQTDVFNINYNYNLYGTLKTKTIKYNNQTILSLDILHDEKKIYQITNLPITYRYTMPNHVDYQIEYDEHLNISLIKKDNEVYGQFYYDSLNRIIREDNYGLNRSYGYSYDANGNLVSRISQRFTLEDSLSKDEEDVYVYEKDRLTSYNEEVITYDKRGNNSSLFGNTLSFNERNQLSKYGTISFEYDGTGLRRKKNGIVFYYDSNGRLIKESRGKSYYYDQEGILGMSYQNEYYVYIKDPLGNIVGLMDSQKNIVAQYIYDAWGNHKVVDDTGNEITSTSHIGHQNPFRYKSYYYDSETGLYYLKSRYYSPILGRFISPDSIDYAEPEVINGLNLYAYCNNNPVMYSDGSGCYSTPTDWFSSTNIFGFSSTLGQLLINGSSIYSYFKIANAVRPANIGLGIWNSGKKAALESFKNVDVPKFQKASNILGALTVGIQVISAGISDYNKNYSTDRIISNAVVNTAIYSATTFGCAYVGGFIGSFIPIPIVGTAVGTAVGYAIGFGIDLFLEWEINGKSVIDYARDWIYDIWTGWFK